MTDGRDQFDADPWGPPLEVPEWDSTPEPAPGPEPVPGPAGVDGPQDGLGAAGRSAGAPLALLLVAVGALVMIGVADGWRLLLLAAFVAAIVMVTHLRFSAYAAVGLLLVVALLAIGQWGPGVDRRPAAPPAHGDHRTRS